MINMKQFKLQDYKGHHFNDENQHMTGKSQLK
jgi:hypothetical protein